MMHAHAKALRLYLACTLLVPALQAASDVYISNIEAFPMWKGSLPTASVSLEEEAARASQQPSLSIAHGDDEVWCALWFF